jgi:hypothetical protein
MTPKNELLQFSTRRSWNASSDQFASQLKSRSWPKQATKTRRPDLPPLDNGADKTNLVDLVNKTFSDIMREFRNIAVLPSFFEAGTISDPSART